MDKDPVIAILERHPVRGFTIGILSGISLGWVVSLYSPAICVMSLVVAGYLIWGSIQELRQELQREVKNE